MPIIKTYPFTTFELFVWNIIEPASFFVEALDLTINELDLLHQKYKNPIAFQQWLASRCALQKLFNCSYQAFQKDNLGKLSLEDSDHHLSISHSDAYVAVVKSKQAVGVDIQVPNPKLERIAGKYIAKDLLTILQKSPHYIDYLHVYWGIKEALFKAYGLGKVDFIKHLHINAFELNSKGNTRATVRKQNFQANYQVFYEKTANYYLCIVTKE